MTVLASAVDTWATVAVAIGTLGAVGYALFRDLVLENRRRPRLELHFDPGGSDRLVDADEAFVRLRMSNGAGKDTADDVVVIVTELRSLEPGGTTAEARPIGLPLAWWSGSNPRPSVATVHPGSERHIAFLHVANSEARLDVAPEPQALAAGRYELDLEVRARNADASRYTVRFDWDGEPRGDAQIWDHLRVEPPSKRP